MPLDGKDSGPAHASAGLSAAPLNPSDAVDRFRSYTEAARGAFAPHTERAIRADIAIFTA